MRLMAAAVILIPIIYQPRRHARRALSLGVSALEYIELMPLRRAGRRNYSYARPAECADFGVISHPSIQLLWSDGNGNWGLPLRVSAAAACLLLRRSTQRGSSPRCAFSKKSHRVRIAFRRPAPRGCNWIQRAASSSAFIDLGSQTKLYVCVREKELKRVRESGRTNIYANVEAFSHYRASPESEGLLVQ